MAQNVTTAWRSWAPYFLSLLRIVAGFCFMLHGTAKLFAFPAGSAGHGTVELMSQMGLDGIIEAYGGALIMIGHFTPTVAFIASGEMAVAYFQAHAPQGFWPTLNRGELALIFCFLWLYFSVAGAGPWSLDAMRRK